jgi:hypothetical protein
VCGFSEANETMGVLTPWGLMLEFVSFPNGRKYIENRDRLLWSPVDPAA